MLRLNEHCHCLQDVQASVDRLLHSAEQIAHSDPASTDKLRSQTRAISSLCDHFMQRLDDRRRLLQATLDFYNNAEMVGSTLSLMKSGYGKALMNDTV